MEQRGLPTVYVGAMLDVMKLIRPPRAAFVDFPLGHPFGRPNDRELQLSILRDALSLLNSAGEPGTIVELPYGLGEPFTYKPRPVKPKVPRPAPEPGTTAQPTSAAGG